MNSTNEMTVSVIITIKNEEKNITNCLKSIMNSINSTNPISVEAFKEQIRKLDLKTIIELYDIIEEILFQHEDEQLASYPQLRDAMELA